MYILTLSEIAVDNIHFYVPAIRKMDHDDEFRFNDASTHEGH